MKKLTKGLILVLCAAVLVAGSVMGTLAWLTAQDTITNTFTVGNIQIDLTEEAVNVHKLIPGAKITKNSKVTVINGSEKCYLFVKIENGITGVEANSGEIKPVADQMMAKGWKLVAGKTNVYYYEGMIDATSGNVTQAVFDYYAISEAATDLSDYDNETVVVTAYALQATAVGETIDADKALTAWNANFGTNP